MSLSFLNPTSEREFPLLCSAEMMKVELPSDSPFVRLRRSRPFNIATTSKSATALSENKSVIDAQNVLAYSLVMLTWSASLRYDVRPGSSRSQDQDAPVQMLRSTVEQDQEHNLDQRNSDAALYGICHERPDETVRSERRLFVVTYSRCREGLSTHF